MGKDRLAEFQVKNLEVVEEQRQHTSDDIDIAGDVTPNTTKNLLPILDHIRKIDSEYLLKLSQNVEQLRQLQVDLLLYGKEERLLERIYKGALDLHKELKNLMTLIMKHGKFRVKHKLMVTSHLDRLSKEINRIMKVFRSAHLECMELEEKKLETDAEEKEMRADDTSVEQDVETLLMPDMESWDRTLQSLDQSVVEIDQLLLVMEQGRSLALTADGLMIEDSKHFVHLKRFRRKRPMSVKKKRLLIGAGIFVAVVAFVLIIIGILIARNKL